MSAKLLKAGLTQLILEYSVFIQNVGSRLMVIVVIFVDDFLVFGLNKSEINNIKWWLNNNYKMKDLEICRQFSGIKVERDENCHTISISQIVFINKILMVAEMQDCKRVSKSIIGSPNFSQNTEPPINEELVQLYQSHIQT